MRRITAFCLLLTALLGAPRAAASKWIIVDDNTGHILAASDQNERSQIASLTKIATAMVVIDWAEATGASLAELVSVPAGVSAVGGVNPCGLQPGERVSLRDLLYSAMMSSDNHAAYTLAWNVGSRLPNPQGLPPVDNFTAQMNALARKLGMKRSVFLNPHGLDSMTPPPHRRRRRRKTGIPFAQHERTARTRRNRRCQNRTHASRRRLHRPRRRPSARSGRTRRTKDRHPATDHRGAPRVDRPVQRRFGPRPTWLELTRTVVR
jgi:beta-lactamase class A